MNKLCFFIILILLKSTFFAEGNVIVLCYHSFLGKKFNTDFSPEIFSNQMEMIKDLGYHFVSFNDILCSNITGDTNILVTIDDGNHSLNSIYDSILKENGIQPVLFIYPAIIDKKYYALTFNDLKGYMNEGAFIGAHGYYHLCVTDKLYRRDRRSFNREIVKAKSALESGLSTNINVYAYPFGSFSNITIKYLKKAGFKYAFSLKQGFLHVPLENNKNLYNLPRYLVEKSTWENIYSMLRKDLILSRLVHKKRKHYANS